MNKYNIKLFAVGALAATTLFTSCEDFADGLLSQTNPNEMSSSIYWKDLEACNGGLASVYNAFKSSSVFSTIQETKRTDLCWPGINGTNKFPQVSDVFYQHTFTASEGTIKNKWASIYKGIFYANQVIGGLETVKEKLGKDLDEVEYTRIKAQAHFFRGLFYFYLNTSYNKGAVPIFDFIPVTSEDFYLPCSTSEDVKAFYRKDLEYAEANLPTKKSNTWKKGNIGRPFSETATAVLGTSYLYDAKKEDASSYDRPMQYFKKIIDSGSFSLAGPGDNASTKNEFNNESLLEVNYTYDFNSEYNAGSTSSLTTLLNREVSHVGGWTSIYPAFWLYQSFSAEPVDKRVSANKIALKKDAQGDIFYSYNPSNKLMLTLGGEAHEVYPIMATPRSVTEKDGKLLTKKNGAPLLIDYDLADPLHVIDLSKPYFQKKFGAKLDASGKLLPDDKQPAKVKAINLLKSKNLDIRDITRTQYMALDAKTRKAISDLAPQSMVWPDSLFVLLKKVKVGNPTKERAGLIGANEGYEFVEDNHDMMPHRPLQGDRSLGAVKIYDQDTDNPYRYRTRSLRSYYAMWSLFDMDCGHYNYRGPTDHGKMGVSSAFKKYTNWETRKTEEDATQADSDINLRLIRLADIYLMYAECLIKGGTNEAGVPEATKYINKVRARAGTVLIGSENLAGAEFKGSRTYQDTNDPQNNIHAGDYYDLYDDKNVANYAYQPTQGDIIDNAKEVMEHLMFRERPMELCLDGHNIRSNDLRRWGVTKDRFKFLSTEYPFTKTGQHSFNWEKVYLNKSISFKQQVKNWSYRMKYQEGSKDYDKYFWQKNGDLAHTGPLYEFVEPAMYYTDEAAYFPIPTDELLSNPKITEIVDREDL